jgi:hypothetical protein
MTRPRLFTNSYAKKALWRSADRRRVYERIFLDTATVS